MKIEINDNRKIFGIQEEFSALFPLLKIDFFAKPHSQNGPASDKVKGNHSKLAECRIVHNEGTITITPQMTVAELYQHFGDVYGLSIKVLRKVGNTWEDTIETQGLTLEEQNQAVIPQ